MTTYTDDGRNWNADKDLGLVSDRIDTIAIGTGANESNTASNLGNEEYRAANSNENVTIERLNETGRVRATIVVQGGTEVPAETEITEVGLIADGSNGGGTLIYIDEFSAVTIEAGHEEDFAIEYEHQR